MGLCFGSQTRPMRPAFYSVLAHQAEILPPASFRFHLAMDTLALS
jgi:hypothetical protein